MNRSVIAFVYVFRRNATMYSEERSAENNLGEDLLGGMGQLHFGWFGRSIVKIVYFALGLGLTYLAASGLKGVLRPGSGCGARRSGGL